MGTVINNSTVLQLSFKDYIMTSVSENVMASMFKHLTASYSPTDARVILKEKYPHATDAIDGFEVDTSVTAESVGEAIDTQTAKIKAAVKARISKPKAPKAESKMDKARALYAAAEDKSRKAMIELFNKELGLSAAAASTYFYSVKG
jgi:hypothetical protein